MGSGLAVGIAGCLGGSAPVSLDGDDVSADRVSLAVEALDALAPDHPGGLAITLGTSTAGRQRRDPPSSRGALAGSDPPGSRDPVSWSPPPRTRRSTVPGRPVSFQSPTVARGVGCPVITPFDPLGNPRLDAGVTQRATSETLADGDGSRRPAGAYAIVERGRVALGALEGGRTGRSPPTSTAPSRRGSR